MAQEVFTEAVVNEYVERGLAEKVDSTTLKGVNGNKIRLGDLIEDTKLTGVKIFNNGLLISSIRFNEKGFGDKLFAAMKSELGL